MSEKPLYAQTTDMKERKALRKKPSLDRATSAEVDQDSVISLDLLPFADDDQDDLNKTARLNCDSVMDTHANKTSGLTRETFVKPGYEGMATSRKELPVCPAKNKKRNLIRQISWGFSQEKKPVLSRHHSVSSDCDVQTDFKHEYAMNNNNKVGYTHESTTSDTSKLMPSLSRESSMNDEQYKMTDAARNPSVSSGEDSKSVFTHESPTDGAPNNTQCVSRDSSTCDSPDKKTGWTYEWSLSDKPKGIAALCPGTPVQNRMACLAREHSKRYGQDRKMGLHRECALSDAQNKMVALIRESNSISDAQNKVAALIREASMSDDPKMASLMRDPSIKSDARQQMAALMRDPSMCDAVMRRPSLTLGADQTDLTRESPSSRGSESLPRECSLSSSQDKKPSLSRESSFSGSLNSLGSLRSAGKRWHASLIHMAMEIRMMIDMAELFEKWRTYTRPKKQGEDKNAEQDDENQDVFKDNNDHPATPPAPSTQPQSPPLSPTSRPPPPAYHTVVMDDPAADGDGHLYTNPHMFTPGASSVNNSNSWDSGLVARGTAIEMDAFRNTPVAVWEEGRNPGGPRGEGEPNGRVAEIGIVLPIVPRPPDSLNTGGGDGYGSTGGGGEKPLGPEFTDEKTPLQGPEDSFEKRDNWENKMDFLLSVIGYAVDLANVWRFPYLCYKNGGGAFLVPYFSVLIFGAMPVFFMELSLGQFHRKGPITVWKMAPMFKGIGMASCFMAYIVAFYYNIIIGWSFFYLFSSFTSSLPWTSCNNSWNSPRCWESGEWDPNVTTWDNRTYDRNSSVTSTLEFFERGVLSVHKSPGLEDLGHVRWQLLLCTLLTFCLLYFCLWKGVKTTGKVVYLTATMPYIILTILLVRGVMLPGAGDGIRFFITPDLSKLGDPQVWIDAAVQIFFSVGAGFGTHIAYASYNKFDNNCQRDCIITVIVNSFTSIFSGFVIFSYLGYMSIKTQKHISQVATEGPGLVFNVYPEAIATLPGSTGWAIIFFFMLLTLGIDSAFGGLESPLTGLYDELKSLLKLRFFREILTLFIVGSAFLCSIPCLTEGGIYVFTILDTFAAGTSILFTVLCQVIAVSWFYGIKNFCRDVERMTGSQPSMYWRICWKFVCPILLLIIVISSIISYTPLTYSTANGLYRYPFYANVIGWCIALSSMLLIPGYALYKVLSTPGTIKERLALCISPEWEHEEIRQKKYVRRYHKEHWLSI